MFKVLINFDDSKKKKRQIGHMPIFLCLRDRGRENEIEGGGMEKQEEAKRRRGSMSKYFWSTREYLFNIEISSCVSSLHLASV